MRKQSPFHKDIWETRQQRWRTRHQSQDSMRQYWATKDERHLDDVNDALQEAEGLSERIDVLLGGEREWEQSQPDAPVRPSFSVGGVDHPYRPSPFKWSMRKATDWVEYSRSVLGKIAVVIDHNRHDNYSQFFDGIFVGRVIRCELLPGGEEHETAGTIDLDEWHSVKVDSDRHHINARTLIDRVIEYGRVDGVTISGNPHRYQIKPIETYHVDVHLLSSSAVEDIGFWELEEEPSDEPSKTSRPKRWSVAALKFYVSGLIQHVLTSSTFRTVQGWLSRPESLD